MSSDSALRTPHSAFGMSIIIDDTDASYPIRIDPTFSDANWISMGDTPHANGYVESAVIDSFGNLYVGGSFNAIGHVSANLVAKWNGTNWSQLGTGISGVTTNNLAPAVNALLLSGNILYAGGQFSTAGGNPAHGIAAWDGTNWSALGSGISGIRGASSGPDVRALAMFNGALCVGGSFTTAGGLPANNIAQWDGTNWTTLGSGMTGITMAGEFGFDSGVYALLVSGNTLYAGGYFTNAGGIAANSIAQWDGSGWSSLGSGITGSDGGFGPDVDSLAMFGGKLYAGGIFNTAGGNPANLIAQWDGNVWSPVGTGLMGGLAVPRVDALTVSGNILYAGGEFTNAGGNAANCLAQWDGTNWSSLGTGVTGAPDVVFTIASSSNRLYAGGAFSTMGGIVVSNLAQWDGTNWSGVALGISSNVNALTVSGSTIYAATTTANGSNYVAQWNGNGWSQLGQNFFFNGAVLALAASSNTLYAGGQFGVGGTNFTVLHYTAQWNGSNWSALNPPLNNYVTTLLVSGSNVYAGGNFSGSVARWNGSTWLGLGQGLNGGVKALAMSGGILYAVGTFTATGSSPTGNIAQWNGTNWSALSNATSFQNGGPGAQVNALAISGGKLYVGGTFTSIFLSPVGQFVNANNIAQWDGTNWSALGQGLNGPVNAIASYGNNVYAAGGFGLSHNTVVNDIAQWDGTKWSALGSGLNNAVNALALSGNTLYVGGNFTTAGTNTSVFMAEAILPINISILTTDGNFGISNGAFGFDISGPSGSNVIIQTSTDLQSWIPLQTNSLGSNGLYYFSDPQPPSNAQHFYRAQLSP